MNVQRVVEVWDPVGRIAGTGYLITDRLVLTAYHNVQGAGSTSPRAVELRRLALHGDKQSEWVAAEVQWPEQPPDIEQDPHTDAALLRITDPAWQPPALLEQVRWGRLPTASAGAAGTRVDCVAVGFPEAEQRDGTRDTKEISGHIETLSGLKSGLITAHIDDVATPHAADWAPWSGASGAVLFCGNLLTGVLTTDRAGHYPGNQLIAVPLTTLSARPGFTTVIKAAGNELIPEDITAPLKDDHPAAGPYDVDASAGLHNLPDLPPRVFVGRKQALSDLSAAMEQGSKAITQTIQGLGGVGKTTLALHYAHAHRDSYRLVWWIRADTPEQIITDLAGLTTRIQGDATGRTITEDAEWAIGWLQTHPGWLLVLDNAEHPDTTRHLLGQLHHAGRHLITSRFAHGWPSDPIALPLFTPSASLDLLTQLTGLKDPDNEHHIRLLADELGHLPLALEQAGAFIAESCISVSDYRDLLRQHPAQTTSTAPTVGDAQRTMARIWHITLDALHRTIPLAVDILRTTAWYAPNAIPRGLLAGLTDDPVSYAQALSQLAAYSMITLSDDSIVVHRLVQTVLRATAPVRYASTPQPSEAALNLLYAAMPSGDPADVQNWPEWQELLPHVQAASTYCHGAEAPSELADLLGQMTSYLTARGQTAQALPLAKRALEITQATVGPRHPDTATCLNNLAITVGALGGHADAVSFAERALDITENALGPNHPTTAIRLSNLAAILDELGRHDEALHLAERALDITETALGPNHPDTAVRLGKLAETLSELGRHADALPRAEQALAITEAAFGPDHPTTAIRLSNLARTLSELGRHTDALPRAEQALAITEAAFGPDHPTTAIRLGNLAATFSHQGDHDTALPLAERALAITETTLGPDHPTTAIRLGNLAATFRELGRHADALPLEERALTIAQEVLGPDHPDTALRLGNIAITLSALGRHAEALPMKERAHVITEALLGPDHPITVLCRNNLASLRHLAANETSTDPPS
ncbi:MULTISPECIES: FxSxx-COOH system tetratricopeptide repeat protein [unclassified Streptomyces]|uniref:FxSxx-COOH system tetratricopeptide repeat protein n=1 Tax=unclassified Streptomyces TaxID=2593676 RepID=UPI003448C007